MVSSQKKRKIFCFAIEGFSGSGKSSLGRSSKRMIAKIFGKTVLLDGDKLRKKLNFYSIPKDYTKSARARMNYSVTKLINNYHRKDVNVIYVWVGLNNFGRNILKRRIKNLVIIHVKSNLKDCRKHKKKVYKLNKNIVGVDIKPDFPKKPKIVIKNNFKKPIKRISFEMIKKLKKLYSYE